MFATSFGNVRRNDLSDFVQINRNGKIAMKPGEGERIIGVETCNEDDDVLLTSSSGRAIRFPVDKVRVFRSCGTRAPYQPGSEWRDRWNWSAAHHHLHYRFRHR